MSQTYFLELLPGNLTETLHTASVDSPDKKVIKRIVIFQTILKLLSNNFLHILLKTQSVAYLHIGLSEWHETQVTTSPWATKAQNLSKAFTYVTPGGAVHFDASPKKTSTMSIQTDVNAPSWLSDVLCYRGYKPACARQAPLWGGALKAVDFFSCNFRLQL